MAASVVAIPPGVPVSIPAAMPRAIVAATVPSLTGVPRLSKIHHWASTFNIKISRPRAAMRACSRMSEKLCRRTAASSRPPANRGPSRLPSLSALSPTSVASGRAFSAIRLRRQIVRATTTVTRLRPRTLARRKRPIHSDTAMRASQVTVPKTTCCEIWSTRTVAYTCAKGWSIFRLTQRARKTPPRSRAVGVRWFASTAPSCDARP